MAHNTHEAVWHLIRSRFEYWKRAGVQLRTALDIGACVGQWTDMIRSVFPTIECHMVEADPRCWPWLNVKYDRVYEFGLSNKEGTLPFYRRPGTAAVGSGSFHIELTETFQNDYETIEVPVTRMDKIFGDATFDIIKMDIQGSEIDAMRGGEEIVKRAMFVQIECPVVKFNEGSVLFSDMILFMKDWDFEVVDFPQLHHMLCQNDTHQIVQADCLFLNNRMASHGPADNIPGYPEINK